VGNILNFILQIKTLGAMPTASVRILEGDSLLLSQTLNLPLQQTSDSGNKIAS